MAHFALIYPKGAGTNTVPGMPHQPSTWAGSYQNDGYAGSYQNDNYVDRGQYHTITAGISPTRYGSPMRESYVDEQGSRRYVSGIVHI